jgi:NAD(P)-dependent dehydrogenase (short-subunit alcohol dehydrogenase family)
MGRYSLNGQVALVTGAARGIGAATARALHARGASVALVDLQAPDAFDAERTLGLAADVTDREAIGQAVEATVARFGGLDVIVANAGIAPYVTTALAMDPDVFERVVEVDLLGVWRTVRAGLPQVAQRGGHVVLVASVYAFANGAGASSYAVAKAGVEQLGRALRVELAQHGASTSVAYFGFIDTDMVRATDAHPSLGPLRANGTGPLGKTYPLSQVGKAVLEGMEKRSRWVVVPRWSRALLVLRTAIAPLFDKAAFEPAAEADRLFQQDVDNRGVEAASAPMGPGGDAARQREAAGAP